jgi:hypothetical protein
MKGLIPPHTGLQEFVKQIVALRQVDPESIQEAIVSAEAEMMANGIVAVGDISNTLDTLTQKAKHNLAYYSFVELYDLDPTRAADKILEGLEMQKQFQENCVRASIVPHAPYSVTNDLWLLLSAHFGIHTISMHNQETPDENEFFKTKSGSFLGIYERTKVSLDFFKATGLSSLQSNTTGNNNISMGVNALVFNTTGSNNVGIGNSALLNNTASNNTAVGYEAGFSNTSGEEITAIGYQALKNSTGNSNTAIGFQALTANTSGQANVAVGTYCTNGNTTGSGNTAIGYGCSSGNFSSSLILGRDATATANNQAVFGSAGHNAGALTSEVVVSDATWTVIINGVQYKILLKA